MVGAARLKKDGQYDHVSVIYYSRNSLRHCLFYIHYSGPFYKYGNEQRQHMKSWDSSEDTF